MRRSLSTLLYILVLAAGTDVLSISGMVADANCLDLETAWERVLHCSPGLAASNLGIVAKQGEALQASLKPNPLLEVEAENLGVTGHNRNAEPPQTTFAVSQLFELGGKRRARFELASSEARVAFWDLQIARQDLRLELVTHFITVAAAHECFKFSQQKRETVEKLWECVAAQVQGGKCSPLHQLKAEIQLEEAYLEEREAFAAYEESKRELSLLWGTPCPDFEGVFFDLYAFCPPTSLDLMLPGLYQTPDYARAKQAVTRASRLLCLEKVCGIPDLVLTAGVRWFNDSNAVGGVVAAEMPIPFFNCNLGNIRRAAAEWGQAGFLLDESVRLLQEGITLAYGHLQIAYETSLTISQGLLTSAEKAFCWTQEGYQGGKLDYMELLEAEKMVYEVQEKYVASLLDYHLHQAELARLCGGWNE